jgi:propionyl-CoA synthetase
MTDPLLAYQRLHRQSLQEPEKFWADAAQAIHWDQPWDRVLDDRHPPFYRWFSGGRLNTCYNALDRHADGGRGEQLALIYDSPVTGTQRRYTYAQLRDAVARVAGALRAQGVGVGDRVVIYMPVVPEALMAMLACARLGAVHSVVFGGFAPMELAKRIDDAQPRVIVSASCGIEPGRIIEYKPLLDEALRISKHAVDRCLILQRPQREASLQAGRDIDWHHAVGNAEAVACVSIAATDPLYILYTSGTTGKPKGVVRDCGGHAVALMWSMKALYDIDAGDVFWTASDVGWAVGHSYMVYGPLLAGATTLMYEGKPVGTPDAGAFWRVISEHRVKALFTAPTAFRAIKKEDPLGKLTGRYDLSSLKTLFLAGERCDPDTVAWAASMLGVPVIDHWWQTETGWSIAGNFRGLAPLPVKPGSASVPAPGYDVQVLDENGASVAGGTVGNLVIKLPMPPGSLPTLWRNDEGYIDSYLSRYPGFYLTGDAGYLDEQGYVWVMSRIDDLINVAGHRLSTGAMEEVLANHPDIAECAVIGVADALKGQLPVGLIVLKSGVTRDPSLIVNELIASVRAEIGALAAFKTAHVVGRLPKTRSGKVLRGTMRAIADGRSFTMPATIDDPAILDELASILTSGANRDR